MKMDNDAVLDKAASLKAEGKSFAMVTVVRAVSPTSAKAGAKAIVEADGIIQGWIGGGCAQPAVIKTAKKVIQQGQAQLIRISPTKDASGNGFVEEGITDFGMTCHSGGTLDIFIDPVIARPVLLLIGAAPAAQTLSALASRVGFSVTVAFPAADAEMFPDADSIIDGFDVSAVKADFIIVATQGKRDEQGLEAAISINCDYIGFIASKTKADKLKNSLKATGSDAERIDAIISPVGLAIDAVTPDEIALSVLAGLIKQRRQTVIVEDVEPETASCCGSAKAVEKPAESGSCCAGSSKEAGTDPVCGMTVEITGAEYHTSYKEKDYYFCCGGCLHNFEHEPEKYLSA
ncbi:MAG: XdhC family protein [Gammaproteobacteria bacterium]|nr:XdhC family protein [Gammaproteobacteria bacterium]